MFTPNINQEKIKKKKVIKMKSVKITPKKNNGTQPLHSDEDKDIPKALNPNIAAVSFDSALSSHVFENPSHKILFEESTLISNDLGIKQVVWEAIEVRLKININTSLNRSLGEYSLNAIHTNLIKNHLRKYFKKPVDIKNRISQK